MKVQIGTGGWSYFKTPAKDALKAYSRGFGFVEVNSTFYTYPKMQMVESWRDRVPDYFEFSVRCNRELTHQNKMEPSKESHGCLERMVRICGALKANILVLQTPATLEIDDAKVDRIGDLLSSANLGTVRLAWEIRTDRSKVPKKLFNLMQDRNIIHSVDLSREVPEYKSDILYTRLFGKGAHNVYQLDDGELEDVRDKAEEQAPQHAIFVLHGPRMYSDAARLKLRDETGEYPMVTKSTGLDSLGEVLSEDAKFPSNKSALVEDQGWKLIDLTKEKRIRAQVMLEKLPDKTYNDIGSVIESLRNE